MIFFTRKNQNQSYKTFAVIWQAKRTFARRFLNLALLTTFSLIFSSFVKAQVCAIPGNDGPNTASGVINTYYPSPTSANASGSTIPVGAVTNIESASTPISTGDLLLIIQMQDASINSSNNSNYGDGTGTGSGFTSGRAGFYEYVVATNSVSTTGGTITIAGSLSRTYRSANNVTSSRGKRTYQVVRIPQYSSLTVSGTIRAASWDGTSGGVVAFDVAGNLNMNSGTVTAASRGFRGGLGQTHTGGSGSNSDFRGMSTNNNGASKGEGIVGTPRHIWNGSLGIDTGVEGYPNGSYYRGAPGNAGGGGNDGRPSNNDENSGGGGGGNGGAGGRGGNSWNSNLPVGGRGGAAFSAAANRVIMGGGGGAGTTNNGATSSASGGLGGGIVLIRTGSVSGSGTINADGGDAQDSNPSCCGDGAGGGGAGGSIIVLANNTAGLSGINALARGGDGGDTLVATSPHGPGGGGGGGIIFSNGSLGSTNVSNGINGTTTSSSNPYGSQPGSSGTINPLINLPSAPGTSSGSECIPDLTVTKSTSTPNVTNTPSGVTANYSVTVSNAANRAAATQLNISDALPQPIANGFTYQNTVSVTLNGGATRPSTTNPSSGVTNPLWSQFTIPGGGSVVINFNVLIDSGISSGTFQNPATATYLDPTRTTSNGTTSASYDSASSTNEDVTVVSPPNVGLVKSCPVPADCTTAPQLPDTELTYQIDFTNTGGANASGLTIIDGVPANTDYKLGSANTNAGTTGMTFVIEFSDDYNPSNPPAATWGYIPTSGAGGADAGFDRNVRAIRWRVTAGTLSFASPNNTGSVSFIVKIR